MHSIFLRNFNLTVINGSNDIRRMLSIYSAANGTSCKCKTKWLLAGSEDFLHSTWELVRVGTLTQDLGHLNDLIESDVSIVLNYKWPDSQKTTILFLLSISWRLIQLANDQRRSTRHHFHLEIRLTPFPYSSLTIYNSQLDSDLQAFPIHCSLLDIVTDFLGSLNSHPLQEIKLPYQEDQP